MVRELSEEKRTSYLNSALKLFASKGVQNTTTAEIAREAGTAAGTLFLYFPTKQDLVDGLVIMICKQESDRVNSLLDPTLSVHDTFFQIWDGSIRWFIENPDAYRFSQQIRDSNLVSDSVTQETAKLFSFYYITIQKGLNEGCIKPCPIDLIGGFLYQDIVAVMNHIHMQAEPGKLDESIREGFELFWDGIRVNQK